jgi:hypothetical protein
MVWRQSSVLVGCSARLTLSLGGTYQTATCKTSVRWQKSYSIQKGAHNKMSTNEQTSGEQQHDWVYYLDKFLNPYFNRHRKYAAVLKVAASESETFNFCASTFHAIDWRYELHRDLGRIIALRPYRNSWLSMIFENANPASYGVDILVEVEPLESGVTVVGITTESRRGGCITFGFTSWDEKWHYEAKAVAEQFLSVLITILDRKGAEYGEFTVIDPSKL